jgi:hypothetical protein
MSDKAIVYVFVGDGLGVPGLAHEITQEQAEVEGVGALLAECIEKGVYRALQNVPPGYSENVEVKLETGRKGRKGK